MKRLPPPSLDLSSPVIPSAGRMCFRHHKCVLEVQVENWSLICVEKVQIKGARIE